MLAQSDRQNLELHYFLALIVAGEKKSIIKTNKLPQKTQKTQLSAYFRVNAKDNLKRKKGKYLCF